MTTPAPVSDGRSARSQRTREAVVDALLALIREGKPRPTAKEIAERASISLRSVYVHFDDLEDLFFAAAQRQMATVAAMIVPIPPDGAFADRVDTMCRLRGRIYEEVGPVRRAAALQAPCSPTLSALMVRVRAQSKRGLVEVFANELTRIPEPARTERLAALDAASSAEAWELWRGPTYGLSFEDAVRAMANATTILLSPPGLTEGDW